MIDNLVEVKLKNDEAFLLVKETLTRIGVASKKDKTLFQSCHILHKQGKYYVVHFKEMFLLDGKEHTDFSESDIARRNTIVRLLVDWGLVEIVNKKDLENEEASVGSIKIIPFKEKSQWNLQPKYSIGIKK
jgi:hypothetical protein